MLCNELANIRMEKNRTTTPIYIGNCSCQLREAMEPPLTLVPPRREGRCTQYAISGRTTPVIMAILQLDDERTGPDTNQYTWRASADRRASGASCKDKTTLMRSQVARRRCSSRVGALKHRRRRGALVSSAAPFTPR